MENLPEELVLIVMEYIEIQGCISLSRTCKSLNNLLKNNQSWLKKVYKRELLNILESILHVKVDDLYGMFFYKTSELSALQIFTKEKTSLDKIKDLLYLKGEPDLTLWWDNEITTAYDSDRWDVIGLLLDRGRISNKDIFDNICHDIMFSVIKSGKKMRKKIIRLIVKRGYNVNFQDYDRCSVLVCAIRNDHLQFIEFLVKELGADVNKAFCGPSSLPLAEAIDFKNTKIIKFLMRLGADKSLLDEYRAIQLQKILLIN